MPATVYCSVFVHHREAFGIYDLISFVNSQEKCESILFHIFLLKHECVHEYVALR